MKKVVEKYTPEYASGITGVPAQDIVTAARLYAEAEAASIIYTMGITAELKGFIDRQQYLWARKFILKTLFFSDDHIKRHKGLFVSTAGQNWDHVFDGAFPAITAIFNGTGFEYYDNIIANNMDEYKGIRNHPTAMKEAFDKGQKVVSVIEKLNELSRQ
jgi:multimeric flavodoxin WrbA